MGALMTPDIVLFPHCDLHLALSGAPPLTLQVFDRVVTAGGYTLTPIAPGAITVDFFAPHRPVGQRLLPPLPAYNSANGQVTAAQPGVYLFQVRRGRDYIVGRLQVHTSIVAWWFGNDSITTAVDAVAHAQPSIYAKFSDDPTGTDLIGDITGHGYVTLTSADTATFVVTPQGRLRGLRETTGTPGTVDLTGTLVNQTQRLPVRVVNYAKHRRDLKPVQTPNVAHAAEQHNIVFLAEGFRKSDEGTFDKIVTRVVDQMFDQPRHQPYPMLEGSFNIFKAFGASQEHCATVAHRIADADQTTGTGVPIPFIHPVSENENVYTLRDLVAKVGLPMRNENRANLKDIWAGQELTGFDRNKVDGPLLEAWKKHQGTGILHARDTLFGMHLGCRWGDRSSGRSAAVIPPGSDQPGTPGLREFIARLYEFYEPEQATRALTPDPRRHPPERFAGRDSTNPGNLILQYLAGLEYAFAPFHHIGPVWEPDDANFKPSRGLVALITYDEVNGGSNVNNNTLTALTTNKGLGVEFEYAAGDKRVMRRKPSSEPDVNFTETVDTVAHEFGHSFGLMDEYENSGGDDPNAPATSTNDILGDNVSMLGFLRINPAPDRQIDVTKVKWFALPRMRHSARLVIDSAPGLGGIEIVIDKRYIAPWQKVAAQNPPAEVHLRNFHVSPQGIQLPLATGSAQVLTNLKIAHIEPELGTMTLDGPGLPPAPFPTFAAGSAVYVPLKDAAGQLLTVIEPAVRKHLTTPTPANRLPLNVDPDVLHPKHEVDNPRSIPDFKAPCKSSKLIGVYEGALDFAGGYYRPTGACKMRRSDDEDNDGEFCFVCKWLIVNRVDPGYHNILDAMFYPKAKKNG
ncbi:hypothetical protein GCM10023088_16730 [Actinomadura verrucosospora]